MDLLALTWNNHKKTFFSSISACRSNGQYTDVTLVCDGEYYPVHKLVLSSSSDYFKDIFDKITQPNLAVCLKEVKPAELEALLNYMYLGRAEVKHANIAELMKAAEYLMIKGLFTSDVKEEKGDRSDADSTNGSSDSVEDKTYKPSTSGSRINDDSHIPSLRKRKHESPGRDAQSNKKQREGSSDESVKDTKLNKNSGIALPRIKMDIKSPVQSIKKKNRDGAGPSGQKGILMNYLESGKASQMPSSSADKTLDDDSYIPDESADQWEDIENSVSADRDKDEDLKDDDGGEKEKFQDDDGGEKGKFQENDGGEKGKHPCPYCKKSVTKLSSLVIHVMYAHLADSKECLFCSSPFDEKKRLLHHMRQHKSQIYRLATKNVKKEGNEGEIENSDPVDEKIIFSDPPVVLENVETDYSAPSTSMPEGDNVDDVNNLTDNEEESEEESSTDESDDDDIDDDYTPEGEKGSFRKDGKRKYCPYCSKVVKKMSSLILHIMHVHLAKDLRCLFCNVTFDDKYTHLNHMKTHRREIYILASKGKKYEGSLEACCQLAKEEALANPSAIPEEYKQEMSDHEEDSNKIWRCPKCCKGYKYKKFYLTHVKYFHAQPGTQRPIQRRIKKHVYKCSGCLKFFSTKQSFKKHVRLHCPTAYNCLLDKISVLAQSFTQRKKPVCKCSDCDKIYSQPAFREHIKTECRGAYNLLLFSKNNSQHIPEDSDDYVSDEEKDSKMLDLSKLADIKETESPKMLNLWKLSDIDLKVPGLDNIHMKEPKKEIVSEDENLHIKEPKKEPEEHNTAVAPVCYISDIESLSPHVDTVVVKSEMIHEDIEESYMDM